VYKKGKKYDPINYRPVSLTCVSCKLMEHIKTSHMMSHANTQSIMYPLQHGFQSGLSCESQLIGFIDDVTKNEQRNMMVKIGAICVASSLRTRGVILSGPAALFGFRFFRSLCTPFSVILDKRKKKSRNSRDEAKFKELKRHTQREIRKTYWKYIDSIKYLSFIRYFLANLPKDHVRFFHQ
jgi:hypothetical protein